MNYPLVNTIGRLMFLTLIFSLLSHYQVVSQNIPDLPDPPRLVNDYAGLFSNSEISALENKLVSFSDTNSTQIVVVVVNSLHGYDITDFSQRLAQQWGIGQARFNNGVIIVLKPRNAEGKGEVNIDVGYGLEHLIPDITAKQIIEREMIPRFRENDYYGGIDTAVNAIMSLAAGHFTAEGYAQQGDEPNPLGFLVPIIILIIVITWINRSRGNQYNTGSKSSMPFWTAVMLGSMMSHGSKGSYGNFKSGSGGFGGGGRSGGFGGFGGGRFGGGGASGSW
ncbi:MAG: TPM domain-containing protein [Bacteroidales bacterium]